MLRNKKGSTLVEASMIFPLVIACVMAVIYIVIGLYLSLSLQSELQISLRKEAGKYYDTVIRLDEYPVIPADEDRFGKAKVLIAEKEKKYKVSKLFTKDIRRTERGRVYLINEKDIVRPFYLIKEGIT